MSKKTKSETAALAAPTTEAAAPAAEAKTKAESTHVFKRVLGEDGKGTPVLKSDGTAGKLAPQALLIINTIEAAGPEGITRTALNDALVAAGIVTRQPVGRIVTYYQKSLVDGNLITITK